MALDRTEQIIAGALIIGILYFVVSQKQDEIMEDEADGKDPKGGDKIHRFDVMQTELRKISEDLHRLSNDFNLQDAQKAQRLPKANRVEDRAEAIAKRLHLLREEFEGLYRSLPFEQKDRMIRFQEEVQTDLNQLERILSIGGARTVVYNTQNIAQFDNRKFMQHMQQLQNFDQRQYSYQPHLDQRAINFGPKNMELEEFQDEVKLHNTPGGPEVGEHSNGAFNKGGESFADGLDDQMARFLNDAGLNNVAKPLDGTILSQKRSAIDEEVRPAKTIFGAFENTVTPRSPCPS